MSLTKKAHIVAVFSWQDMDTATGAGAAKEAMGGAATGDVVTVAMGGAATAAVAAAGAADAAEGAA
jgi:hypothetical protein